ncbi:MAG: Na+/H+ antiporter NhaA [Polyangiaceae bacterium]
MAIRYSQTNVGAPPETSLAANRLKVALMAPIEAFLHVQAASGLLLLAMAVIALVWANSPWHESYAHLWHYELGVEAGNLHFKRPLHFWINDGLMTIFFFVVGLEIKREILDGELSELKRAALPIAAAIGGMLVPALIFMGLNPAGEPHSGWGIPMATDIAFAVGILSLLGPRVPAALRILLLALAIIDDIGAIIVIAIFYSKGIQIDGLVLVGVGFALVFVMQRFGVRLATMYIPGGVLIWAGMLRFGVHPTIAGVLLGLATPHVSWFGKEGFLKEANKALADFNQKLEDPEADDHSLFEPLDRLATARREAFSPLQRLESNLHGYVAYFIMPVFALANAGVNLQGIDLDMEHAGSVGFGVALGLVLGKPVGITLAAFLAVKLGIAALPRGVNWRGVFVVGCVGGIGFTMAIFIAELAFAGSPFLGVSKLAVLIGSGLIAVIGLVLGKLLLSDKLPEEIARISVARAESSTEY